jgi:DNA-directed RNA polymerase specialized sigma subunit
VWLHAIEALCRAIGALEPYARRFVDLYFERQWTHRQIAAELGDSERTIERLHARVLAGLRQELTQAGVQGAPPPEGRPPADADRAASG